MAIVMGLDQHRAQITADWLDTDSGEVSRARVAPTDRAGVRRFLERFAGASLRSRWRRRRAGGSSSRSYSAPGRRCALAEPAETAARRGNKKRAKNDRPTRGICASW